MKIFQVAGNNETTVVPDPSNSTDNQAVNNANAPSGESNVMPNGQMQDPNSKEEPVVVMDGPLGRIYTQALNLAYAKEDTSTMAMVIDAAQAEKDSSTVKDGKGTYVYAIDGSHLDGSACVKMSNWMTNLKKQVEGTLIVSLECVNGRVPKNSGLIEALALEHGAKVLYSREKTLEHIRRLTKR